MYTKTIEPSFEENKTSSMYRTTFDRQQLNARIHRKRIAPSTGAAGAAPTIPWPANRGS